jgi:hypothetical protein
MSEQPWPILKEEERKILSEDELAWYDVLCDHDSGEFEVDIINRLVRIIIEQQDSLDLIEDLKRKYESADRTTGNREFTAFEDLLNGLGIGS